MKYSLDNLSFSNSFASLPENFYSRVRPTPFKNKAHLIHLQRSNIDYTVFFRELCRVSRDETLSSPLRDLFQDWQRFDNWMKDYRCNLVNQTQDDEDRQRAMRQIKPRYVLRNYLAQVAIDKAEREKDFSEIDALLKILHALFDDHPGMAHYAAPPPDWAGNLQVSCSS